MKLILLFHYALMYFVTLRIKKIAYVLNKETGYYKIFSMHLRSQKIYSFLHLPIQDISYLFFAKSLPFMHEIASTITKSFILPQAISAVSEVYTRLFAVSLSTCNTSQEKILFKLTTPTLA